MRSKNYEQMDEALMFLANSGPDLRNGLTNHAPMATEALCAMDRADAVIPWLERYKRGLTDRPSPHGRIPASEWRGALGNEPRFADWSAFFEEQLKENPWTEAVKQWAPRLAPGLAGAATHGIIRAGHAIRSLSDRETAPRLRELADALGYWAATYQSLPDCDARGGGLSPSQAIGAVPLYPIDRRGRFPTIVEALHQLDDFAPFKSATAEVNTNTDASGFLSDLTGTFARVYLTNVSDVLSTIVFVHSITAPAALRPIAPYLDRGSLSLAMRYAWQACAALYSVFGVAKPADGASTQRVDAEGLIQRAIDNGDEHAIKLTEVCLREHTLNPEPAYLAAAHHAIGRL